MRKLIWGVVAVALVGPLWWAVAMWSLSAGLQGWLAERRSEGWQAEITDLQRSGFPSTVAATLEGLALADPETGLALRADTLTVAARTLWPGDLSVTLPQTPIRFATPTGLADLSFDAGRADLNLAPGSALELENLSFASGPLRAESPTGGLFAASSSALRMVQTEAPERYEITLNMDQFTPGAVPRAALRIPESWPLVFTAFDARASVRFSEPWSRAALDTARPQPRQITIERAEAHWGEIRLQVTGALDVDATGVPSGEIVVRAQNWEAMLDLAEQAGVLPSEQRGLVQNVLTSLARGSGRTADLDLTLQLEGGLIRLGFLPLGPAPRLLLR